ncbi:MAG: 50S ribosomal protein L17 [Candidatus Marinimicrobia bacterium]|jgi:large subunit ribosomal protein L17|nr:50S ribosomal protein L17 [Candidatus Neomarinimicrobiota bacterium]MBT3683079.1 50S ribosomal protein L17 [Candidatus Neomarinimicrobiota bacterium]MBT3759829.1 50S ribosomal protein L17 [Candidatus Neomarinimicrobiota bacterium]MBT3895718.1 50S ribosomal protein L17 [Candidatus Neomarinimicrobiota bacterium]MBT4173243.1 50S ribosomal protein L17 [Candidatus Neomarinimicrobiota bacterium]
MRHQKRGRKLNRTMSHRKALMMNLSIALITHKQIKTTDAKAKELRGYVERLVTYAKKGGVHGFRLIQKKLPGKTGKIATNVLIHELAPAYKERSGGYTRIIKLNNRKNDNAPVSLIEFVDFQKVIPENVVEEPEVKE